jgi:hypothetical protein
MSQNFLDGPRLQLGYNFPSANFQVQSIEHILSVFKTMSIQYSIDIADNEDNETNWCPLFNNISNLPFGSFDDTSFSNDYKEWNDGNKGRLGWNTTRYQQHPLGGEIAYVEQVQQHALDINGPEGQSLPDYVKEYKYTFLIASDQTTYKYDGPLTQVERIKQVRQNWFHVEKLVHYLCGISWSKSQNFSLELTEKLLFRGFFSRRTRL